jgi:hypothetical protein
MGGAAHAGLNMAFLLSRSRGGAGMNHTQSTAPKIISRAIDRAKQ